MCRAKLTGSVSSRQCSAFRNRGSRRIERSPDYRFQKCFSPAFAVEATVIIDNLSKIPGGEKLVEDVILSINRAAEDAAKEVSPIFINSIKQMTIHDAFGILKGADNAATQYLVKTSRTELYNLYQPKISQSTGREILGGVSARESWDALTGKWNMFANSVTGKLAGFTPVNTDLDDYLTNKALDGMFLKVQEEEKKIRQNISARVTPLLKKVFGSLDN